MSIYDVNGNEINAVSEELLEEVVAEAIESAVDTTDVIVKNTESAIRANINPKFHKIVSLDCGRKYFSKANIKTLIDNMYSAGLNELELHFSENQGFTFALDDMNVYTPNGTSYDLTQCLGSGDGSNNYLTESEMKEICAYGATKGIEVLPSFDMPGHMGKILNKFSQFQADSSTYAGRCELDISNSVACEFAFAIIRKYARWFALNGAKHYNICADETTYGTRLQFVSFLNEACQNIAACGLIPRAFNDNIFAQNDLINYTDRAIQVCVWRTYGSTANPLVFKQQGLDMINANYTYLYWVLKSTGSANVDFDTSALASFDIEKYHNGGASGAIIPNPNGVMFCIWCDSPSADGQDDGSAVIQYTASAISTFGTLLSEY